MSYDGVSGKAFSPRRANYDGTDFILAKSDLPSYELLEYWDGKGQSFSTPSHSFHHHIFMLHEQRDRGYLHGRHARITQRVYDIET